MSGGGPNPGQLIPTNGPNGTPDRTFNPLGPQPTGSPLSPRGVGQFSDEARSGPPQVNVPYTPEAQQQFFPNGRPYQQHGTLEQDENGQAVRVLRGNEQPYTPPPPIAGPSANTLPPAGVAPPNGLFDNLGGYGGGYGGPPRRLF